MNLRSFRCASRIVAVAGLGALAAGCGKGSSRYPDASLSFDSAPDRAKPVTPPRPAPSVGSHARLLVPGRPLLIGTGPDSCTSLTSISGDVWCGFALPSAFLGLTDLWVINVSKAMAGKDIKCNGGDPDCLLLTSTLAAGSNQLQKYALHAFTGDTLIYYASDDGSGSPAYAWRPGWPTGKLLALDAALGCGADAKGRVAYCLGNIDQTSVARQASTDIFMGAIGEGSTPLPKIDSAIVKLDTESNITKFQVGFSPAGDWFAWSARPTADGVETLHAQKVADPTTRQVIAADVTRWSIARDGLKWYWLKSYSEVTPGSPSGTLQMADFPPAAPGTPAKVDTLMQDVAAASIAGDKGLVVLHGVTAGSGDLTIMLDRGAPATAQTLDNEVVTVMDVARDGKAVLYSKAVAMDPASGSFFFDLYAGGVARPTPCTLSTATLTPAGAGFAGFSPSGGLAVWIKLDTQTGGATGYLSDVAGCTSQMLTQDLWFWSFIGGDVAQEAVGLAWTENGGANQSNAVDATLKYGKLTGETLLTTAVTEVQQRASLTYASLVPIYPALLYTVYVGNADVDGLYVDASLPFASLFPPPAGDGGADATPPGDAGSPDAGAAGDAGAQGGDAAGGGG